MLFSRSTRFVLASHRLPMRYENNHLVATDGGLCSALRSAHIEDRALWIGSLGPDVPSKVVEQLPFYCRNVNIPKEIFGEFYNGYSNSVIWPAFHDRPELIQYEESFWKSYLKVNRLFAEKIVTSTPRNIPVWVHDYQLMLVPYMIKQHQPQRRVNFFMHIPWPGETVAKETPHLPTLVRSLLSSDVICFHCDEYVKNFENYARGLDYDLDEGLHGNIKSVPIGIDPRRFRSNSLDVDQCISWNGKNVDWKDVTNIIGIDRLDYSKGLLEKVEVFAEFLEMNSEWRGKLSLRQLLIPSREDVSAYAQYRQQVMNLVNYVNSKFGSKSWIPIDLFFGRTAIDNLKKIYRAGDICWVNSYKDGMNLVALEYLAAQLPEQPGVLILSNQAGCAEYLSGSLTFNGRSPISACRALDRALNMAAEEKRNRFEDCITWIEENSVGHWVNKNMDLLISPESMGRVGQNVVNGKAAASQRAM